jgi:GNAT superfamily N-acetyltransferase
MCAFLFSAFFPTLPVHPNMKEYTKVEANRQGAKHLRACKNWYGPLACGKLIGMMTRNGYSVAFLQAASCFFTASQTSPRRENMTLFQRKQMLQVIRKTLAANLACQEDDFTKDGVFLSAAEDREGRMKFPVREKSLTLVTMGKGVHISCTADRLDWAREHLGSLTREQLFAASTLARIQHYVERDGQWMAGPLQRYVCSRDDLKPFTIPAEIDVTLVEREDIPTLYTYDQFHHALSYDVHSVRPDVLASVAEHRGHVVGIAGASADCDVMWQIGVDILAEYQGLGIGKALVGTLTQALWKREIIPYYSTTVSNLQSRQLVSSLGYWPAWVDFYTKDL